MTLAVVGIGKPGVPLGDVLSVQGVPGGFPLPVSGSVTALIPKPLSSTNTQVNQNAASVSLAAPDADRLSVSIVNDSTDTLYVRENGAASTVAFTAVLAPKAMYTTNYVGELFGIWNVAGAGRAQITDRTNP